MGKSAFVLFALYLLCTAEASVSMPVLTHKNGVCLDSDGFDPFTKGNASILYADRGVFQLDSCVDAITVREWSCEGLERAIEDRYPCPFGFVCNDGACVSQIVPLFVVPVKETCFDLDGLDEKVRGSVVINRSGKVSSIINDSCAGWFKVSEAYCAEENGTSVKYKLIECAQGSFCLDAACVNNEGIKPVQVFDVPKMQPVVSVSRILPYVASAGSNLSIGLVVDNDMSRVPCAYGISEKIPRDWKILSVSPSGVVGRYPGNGSVRMSEAVSALNAWCLGNETLERAFSMIEKWRESGIAEGVIEWIIFDAAKNASHLELSYTVSIPYNASVNPELYGDASWDGLKYRRTDGFYRMIIQPAVTTTTMTTTTTTTFPVSRVSGLVLLAEERVPVPGSKVTILCAGNTGVRAETQADEHGYYTTEMLCPYGSEVSVHASAPPGDICHNPLDCIYYLDAKGSGSGAVASPGYVRIDVLMFQ
jgi:hypothetical protein